MKCIYSIYFICKLANTTVASLMGILRQTDIQRGRQMKHACCVVLYLQSTRPTGNLVPSMQRVLLTHPFIWAVYRQLTALYRQKKIEVTPVTCIKQKHTDCL